MSTSSGQPSTSTSARPSSLDRERNVLPTDSVFSATSCAISSSGLPSNASQAGVQENTKEAEQRLWASLSLLRSQGKIDDAEYRELDSRLSASLAMVEAVYMEARRGG
jgi:hypothetical protein